MPKDDGYNVEGQGDGRKEESSADSSKATVDDAASSGSSNQNQSVQQPDSDEVDPKIDRTISRENVDTNK
ncbi:hypothetical protein Cyrtocomes_01045 [Candidatus Cyrtobacter comes]|uniref:Uncharacterized protein n=1 Tax=Candidatus Cyrtobacter comes TaxID=675776 RepID=A0ABU5L9Y4_9RICK|nr:hypothetical protein [Candidatus Cyrtobacter comes]